MKVNRRREKLKLTYGKKITWLNTREIAKQQQVVVGIEIELKLIHGLTI